jgi:hypothetical protein
VPTLLSDLNALNEKFPGKEGYKSVMSGNLSFPLYASGPRLNLFDGELSQAVMLKNPDTPGVFTGFEKAYGEYTDGYRVADSNYHVVDVISKFAMIPRFMYLYVVQDMITHVYDIIEVHHCEKMSENIGYLRPFTEGDVYTPGSVIAKGAKLFRATSKDEFDNYRFGVNAKAAFISMAETEEDAQVFRRGFADKTIFYNVFDDEVPLNRNDVLLNIYGDAMNYQCFPGIGDSIKDGILCARRSVNYLNAASELTDLALQHIVSSDNIYKGAGHVTDIDIHVNDKAEFEYAGHRQQILQYYLTIRDYHHRVVQTLRPLVANKQLRHTARLRWIYERSVNYLDDEIKWTSNSTNFDFALIKITTHKEVSLLEGYKTADRNGGKGVICTIWDDDKMPRDEHGNVADIILNPASIIAREIAASPFEQETNFVSNEVRKQIAKISNVNGKARHLLKFMSIVSPEEEAALKTYLQSATPQKLAEFFCNLEKDRIYVHIHPFSHQFSIEMLEKLYKEFDVKPSKIKMRIKFPTSRTNLPIESTGKETVTITNEKFAFMVFNSNASQKIYAPMGSGPVPKHKQIKGSRRNLSYAPFDGYEHGPDGKGGYRIYTPDDIRLLLENSTSKREKSDYVNTRAFVEDGVLVREFTSQNPVIIAEKYMLVLKHVPETKFSARSLGTVNNLGLPNKVTKGSDGTTPYSNSSVRAGGMEVDNLLLRVPAPKVHRFFATYASSPKHREMLTDMLLTKDPFEAHDMDVSDEEIYDTMTALSTTSLLYAIGLEFDA